MNWCSTPEFLCSFIVSTFFKPSNYQLKLHRIQINGIISKSASLLFALSIFDDNKCVLKTMKWILMHHAHIYNIKKYMGCAI